LYTAFKYTLFAVISMVVNIGSQDLSLRLYSGRFPLIFAMCAGTLTGLVVKYVLDKKYIFYHSARNIVHEGNMFFKYTLMGVVTTLIFWGTELTFDFLFKTKAMTFLGAFLGLSVGYLIKYRLDKRYVFLK